jgi:hypothetical protein
VRDRGVALGAKLDRAVGPDVDVQMVTARHERAGCVFPVRVAWRQVCHERAPGRLTLASCAGPNLLEGGQLGREVEASGEAFGPLGRGLVAGV